MKKILIMNGPNLNMLGFREKQHYGSDTLQSINDELREYAESLGLEIDFFQSNHEGELIDKIHTVRTEYDGCVLNAGAYTHYSYAILDAIYAAQKPFVEVHMSDIHKREPFRAVSVISPACIGQICGLGKKSYFAGIDKLIEYKGE
ncbi:MAG: type II 3-dehydroquinate dehydratase [Clostridia bacterium]|nr:type II 3-dehydroquinate dehydratase [Clostridia bacterium]